MEIMELNLLDQLTLLALDDKKGTFLTDSGQLAFSMAGAIIFELVLHNKIDLGKKKVHLRENMNIGDKVLDPFLEMIRSSKKERSLEHWIEAFSNKISDTKKETIKKLILFGIIKKKEEKFLWIFNADKYPARNAAPENELKEKLRHIIECHEEAEVREILLLSLVDACKLSTEVFGRKLSKEEKSNIEAMIKKTDLGATINKTLKDVNEMVTAALFVCTSAVFISH